MSEVQQRSWIASLWDRLAAIIIDWVLLMVLGFILGILFSDYFAIMAGYGIFVGILIVTLYFSLLNSRIGGGQTLGKRLVGIKVINSNNEPLSFRKSLLRCCVLELPFFLNAAVLPFNNIVFQVVSSVLIYGGAFAIAWLIVFNGRNRRSLHDFAADSFVVRKSIEPQEILPTARYHWPVVIAGFILAALLPLYTLFMSIAPTESQLAIQKVQNIISAHPEAGNCIISSSMQTFTSLKDNETSVVNFLEVKVGIFEDRLKDEALAEQFAAIVVQNYPQVLEYDKLRIIFVYGYTIGIAAWSQTYSHVFSREQLEAMREISAQ